MLTVAIPDNGLWLCSKSYAVRSAITATAELLVKFISEPHNVTQPTTDFLRSIVIHANVAIDSCTGWAQNVAITLPTAKVV